MSNVLAEITVKNAFDIERARAGYMSENNVRTVTLTARVDTGARTLIISEDIFNQLGLTVMKITDPVHIQWKNRFVTVSAAVLPESKTILGMIPLEFMDLIIDPVRRELAGAHGDEQLLMAM